jgi:hypothetical protein
VVSRGLLKVLREFHRKSCRRASFVGSRVNTLPEVDIVVAFALGNDHITVPVVKVTFELGVLLYWSKVFNSVDLDLLLTSLCKELLSVLSELLDVGVDFFVVEHFDLDIFLI